MTSYARENREDVFRENLLENKSFQMRYPNKQGRFAHLKFNNV